MLDYFHHKLLPFFVLIKLPEVAQIRTTYNQMPRLSKRELLFEMCFLYEREKVLEMIVSLFFSIPELSLQHVLLNWANSVSLTDVFTCQGRFKYTYARESDEITL